MNDEIVKYDLTLGRPVNGIEMIEVRRIARPYIVDKAGRRQWMKEHSQEDREVLMTIPFTDVPALLQAVAEWAAWHMSPTPLKD
jgi:hypothetical protein